MIVLKDGSLPSVWDEDRGLRSLERNNEHRQQWQGRQQHFRWVNGIRYDYAANNKHLILNVVVCHETWQELQHTFELHLI